MGFLSFHGRLLFASLFILSAWKMFNEFGVDGGPAVKELVPKLTLLRENISSKLGVEIPDIDARHVIATVISFKGIGGFLFVFGSSFGAYILIIYLTFISPLMYDFYNYNAGKPEYVALLNDFLQNVALFGALLYFIGMKNSMPKRQMKKKMPNPKAKTT